MNSANLTPGQRVFLTPRGSDSIYSGEFIERTPKGASVFIVDDFVGCTGPDDIGDVCLSDSAVRQCVKPAEAH